MILRDIRKTRQGTSQNIQLQPADAIVEQAM
ncbi:hypothetical protein WP4W18E05_07220 [Klebsiella sp. WP4-W18-ESBL-05]|nr:hypothetical protein WP4W18E05_07220 [Klebsiella sp. WP4-W18-ESBL-05]